VFQVEIALEQVNDRQIGRGLAVGDRGALEHQPPPGAVGMDALVRQARLADARLPDHGHDLAMTRTRLRQRVTQGLQLGVAPHEAREPTGDGCLDAGAWGWPRPVRTPPPAPPAPSPAPGPGIGPGPSLRRGAASRPSDGCSRASLAVPCAPPGGWSAPPPCSPCAGRCRWPAPPPRPR